MLRPGIRGLEWCVGTKDLIRALKMHVQIVASFWCLGAEQQAEHQSCVSAINVHALLIFTLIATVSQAAKTSTLKL